MKTTATLLSILGIAAFIAFAYFENQPTQQECTCRFKQQWQYSYTKINRECIPVQGGVDIDGTVYVNLEWFRNECQ